MRLAHCSDLHLLSLEGARWLDFANKRWIGGLNLLTSRSRHHHSLAFEDMVEDFPTVQVDHVLCTGDVSNLGLEVEFRYARAFFDKIALGPAGVTVIPGNHDAYVAHGSVHFAAAFADYFAPDPGWGEPWPTVRIRDGVAIVGIDTSLQTPWFTAWGRIGVPQLHRLEEILADPRLAGLQRVVAIHHPPAGKRALSRIRGLRDCVPFAEVLARVGCELVLHGHEHENLAEHLAGPDGPIPVLGVVSGTYDANRPARQARYRVFDIGEGRGAPIVHHLRIWNRDQRAFAPDLDTVGQAA